MMKKFMAALGILCWAGAFVSFAISTDPAMGPFLGGAASAFFVCSLLTNE